ncbi:MAG: hypothetical protein FD155_443 [Bacteroidetes bacterium]|nr:MAG: hypothetical protein FD155_443 [Bacteroidota bacterium]
MGITKRNEKNVTISRADLDIIRNLNEAIQSQLRTIESLSMQNKILREENKELLASKQGRVITLNACKI